MAPGCGFGPAPPAKTSCSTSRLNLVNRGIHELSVLDCVQQKGRDVIVLGIILIIVGLVVPSLSILYTIGGVLVLIGVVLWILGAVGRPVGGRKVWF
jgi:hypothetical protein